MNMDTFSSIKKLEDKEKKDFEDGIISKFEELYEIAKEKGEIKSYGFSIKAWFKKNEMIRFIQVIEIYANSFGWKVEPEIKYTDHYSMSSRTEHIFEDLYLKFTKLEPKKRDIYNKQGILSG